MSLYISGINYESIADGYGVSCTIFVSGCKHNCKGCQSPETHSFTNGIEADNKLIQNINQEILKRPFLSTLVLSGGDPMFSAKEVLELLDKLYVPNNNIWCFTGFRFEELIEQYQIALLNRISVLVDGKFEIDKRDITLPFRGSSNQRLIDVPKSLIQNKVVLWKE